ncbi:hypothetical protein LPB87_20375 [Flavobacterium sp. EDS]|uniref:hypothetical protein n=1 Tax=Flavobacterium sp. EDS TaxID=2897328 RepID=UPI001E369DDF|nr:hypothetical protein [Flavobacterium sp. EDS]MCD0476756.1 hypothetical protein [Flavobacterium sp. EDS]
MSYKQEIKESSRELIWNYTIDSLTKNRNQTPILNNDYIIKLWDYVFNEILIPFKLVDNVNNDCLSNWLSYSEQINNINKRPEELRIAYLCGPEPENDLNHMLELGIRIENIYAFESDKELFEKALRSIKNNFPTLKIYNGKIDSFIKSSFVKFDIIYLDFTTPLFSRLSKIYQSIITLFENRALGDLSCLIVNTTFPDKTDENIDFLTNYFFAQPCFEYSIFDSSEEDNKGRFVESIFAYGIYTKNEFRPYIEKNFKEAYSAFQTNFVINYTNHILPISNVIKNPVSVKRIFKNDKNIFKNKIEVFENSEDVEIEPSQFPLYYFFKGLKEDKSDLSKDWVKFITKNDYNKFNLDDTVKYLYVLLESIYGVSYQELLSESLKKSIPEIMASVPDSKYSEHSVFCDVPMIHLWLELAINQLGYPYHHNTKNHKRYSYKAKEREMCLDIFTFDQCRSLYDWLPMIEYYGDDLKNTERQMMSRICMDAIGKHSLHILQRQYYGSALIGIGEKEWSENHYFDNRMEIK